MDPGIESKIAWNPPGAAASAWRALLEAEGFALTPGFEAALAQHAALVREWNPYASLVSAGDLARLETAHVPDSLSLAAHLRAACAGGGVWLDVGPGGGYPSVPIKLLLPDLPLVWVERSEKKVSVLRRMIAALGLGGVALIHGEFPAAVAGRDFACLTARAVERPERVIKAAAPFIARGAVFLAQSGDPRDRLPPTFHVEQVRGPWDAAGLRRGTLFHVEHRDSLHR